MNDSTEFLPELNNYMAAAARAAEIVGSPELYEGAPNVFSYDEALGDVTEIIAGLRRSHANNPNRQQAGKMFAELLGYNPFIEAGSD